MATSFSWHKNPSSSASNSSSLQQPTVSQQSNVPTSLRRLANTRQQLENQEKHAKPKKDRGSLIAGWSGESFTETSGARPSVAFIPSKHHVPIIEESSSVLSLEMHKQELPQATVLPRMPESPQLAKSFLDKSVDNNNTDEIPIHSRFNEAARETLVRTGTKPKKVRVFVALSRWMGYKEIRAMSLWDLCVPGSHNSASWSLSPDQETKWSGAVFAFLKLYIHCQEKTIYQQLQVGVRFLDLRVCKNLAMGGEPYCAHGGFRTISFRTVLEDIQRFLVSHRSEVIILSVRRDVAYLSGPAHLGVIESDFWVALYLKRWMGGQLEEAVTVGELADRRQNVIYFFEERERFLPAVDDAPAGQPSMDMPSVGPDGFLSTELSLESRLGESSAPPIAGVSLKPAGESRKSGKSVGWHNATSNELVNEEEDVSRQLLMSYNLLANSREKGSSNVPDSFESNLSGQLSEQQPKRPVSLWLKKNVPKYWLSRLESLPDALVAEWLEEQERRRSGNDAPLPANRSMPGNVDASVRTPPPAERVDTSATPPDVASRLMAEEGYESDRSGIAALPAAKAMGTLLGNPAATTVESALKNAGVMTDDMICSTQEVGLPRFLTKARFSDPNLRRLLTTSQGADENAEGVRRCQSVEGDRGEEEDPLVRRQATRLGKREECESECLPGRSDEGYTTVGMEGKHDNSSSLPGQLRDELKEHETPKGSRRRTVLRHKHSGDMKDSLSGKQKSRAMDRLLMRASTSFAGKEILTPFLSGRTRIQKSWNVTTDPDPQLLCKKLVYWTTLQGCARPRKPFVIKMLAGEVTPPNFDSPESSVDVVRYWTVQGAKALMLRNGGLKQSAAQTNKLLLSGILNRDITNLVNGVTHDFVSERVVARVVKLNVLATVVKGKNQQRV